MSGGSFNYALFKAKCEDVFQGIDDYEAIERYLREIGQHEAADMVLAYIIQVKTAFRRLMVYGEWIQPILRAAEWACSGDIIEEDISKAVAETGECKYDRLSS